MAESGVCTNENEMKNDPLLWLGPPPPPDPDVVVGDISCQGVLALTLREALLELQNDSPARKNLSDTSDPLEDTDPTLPLTDEAVDSIMKALGHAIARSQQEDYALDLSAATGSVSSPVAAPTAVLRGRLDHSNRFGSKWRMMVVDAELVPAPAMMSPPLTSTTSSRQRRRSPSIDWPPDESSSQQPRRKLARFEILAYDDIE